MSGEPAWEQPVAGRRPWPLLLALVAVAALGMVLAREPVPAPLEVVEDDEGHPAAPDAPDPGPGPDPGPEGVGRWREVAPAPIVRRTGHSAVWTGEEVLIWGGIRTDPRPHAPEVRMLGQGGAYRPQRDVWRRLPAAPIPPRHGHVAVWTGREMLVWGGSASGPGAAYNPRTNAWRVLADGPLDPVGGPVGGSGGAWTGDALVVWTETPEPAVAAYHPEEDAWTSDADVPRPQVSDAPFLDAGGHLVRWDGAGGLVRLRSSLEWERLAPPPLAPRDGAVVVWASDRLVVWGGADPPRHFADGAMLRLPPYGSGSRMTLGS